MKVKLLLLVFMLCSLRAAFAAADTLKTDSLLTILKKKDPASPKRDLILYLRYAFGDMPVKDLDASEKRVAHILRSSNVPDHEGLIFFVDAICSVRQDNHPVAQDFLIKAIEEANKNDDHYLLYASFTHMAFIQTDQGNPIAAISSFRAAKKEATVIDDAYLQALIDVNLSDIYYRNAMFSQALFYLNEAQSLINAHHIQNERLENTINYNKAEVFFNTQKADSLKKYNELLRRTKKGSLGLYTFQKRTDYYLELLQHQYPKVINAIKMLSSDSLYEFKSVDKQCLAQAYFSDGSLDSAKSIVLHLINDAKEEKSAEINLHSFALLGDIENRQGNYQKAADHYKIALSKTMEQLKRLISVGAVSSQIRIDQVQNSYALRTETYKRERLWLIFIISAAASLIIIVALLYYNVRRKKYYEKLLYESEKKEIAFINSHEVRKHASNIMGIMQVINHAEHRYENFIEAEQFLSDELANLDKAIRNISDRLNT